MVGNGFKAAGKQSVSRNMPIIHSVYVGDQMVTRSKQRLFDIHRIKPVFVKIEKNLAIESMAYLKHDEEKKTAKLVSRRKSVCGRNLFLINEEVVERGFDYLEDSLMTDINPAPPITSNQSKFITMEEAIIYKKSAAMENLCAYNSSDDSGSEEIDGENGEKANEGIQQPVADVCLVQELQPNTEMSILLESSKENQVFTNNKHSLKSNKENQVPNSSDNENQISPVQFSKCQISSESNDTPLNPKVLPKLLTVLPFGQRKIMPNNHVQPSSASKEKNNIGGRISAAKMLLSNAARPTLLSPAAKEKNNEDQISWESMDTPLYPKLVPKLLPILPFGQPKMMPNNHVQPSLASKENKNIGGNISAAIPKIPKLPSLQLLPQADNTDNTSPKILPQLLPVNNNNFNTFNPFRRIPNMPFTLSGRQRSKSADCRVNNVNNPQSNIGICSNEPVQEVEPLHDVAESIEAIEAANSSDSIGTLLYDGSSDDPSSFLPN